MLKTIPFKSVNFTTCSPLKTKAIILNFNNYNFILQQFDRSTVIPSNDKDYSEQEEENLFLDWITSQINFEILSIFMKKPEFNEFIVVNHHFVEFINMIGELNKRNLKEKFNINYDQKDLDYIIKNIKMIDIIKSNRKTNLKIQYLYYLLTFNSLHTIIFNKEAFIYATNTKINTIELLKLLLCYFPIHDLTNVITHRILSEIE